MNKIREGVNFFSEVFPFHPLTAYILPLLAQKLAQNERTVFTFLGSSETFGFQDLTKELDFPDLVMPHHILITLLTIKAPIFTTILLIEDGLKY